MPDQKRTRAFRVEMLTDHEWRDGLQRYVRFKKGWSGPVTPAQHADLMKAKVAKDLTPPEPASSAAAASDKKAK